ncbi:DUF1465 family protein [Sphingomonas sp. Leaf198]|uniref:DUF1465 family protein n=2 Tax=unclassified Sphingomonas TaxID=196159 RepID=UPI000B27B9AD|nr:DUF1465 family protein [Sphingomonas sp. Leaf198]
MHRRLIDALYSESMLLADEARAYFDEVGRNERDGLDPFVRVGFSCESLKVTTRLMHVIAWLLTQRAVQAGELDVKDALDPSRRLGDGPVTDRVLLESLPARARVLIDSSTDLHRRVALLDAAQSLPDTLPSAVRSMHRRLAQAF